MKTFTMKNLIAFILVAFLMGIGLSKLFINSPYTEKRIFVLIGAPGSGKGSFSQIAHKHFDWAQFSTGDLCRQHVAQKTDIGAKIEPLMKSGQLIPDELIIAMVREYLLEKLKTSDAVLLDGFPRTLAQAQALNALLAKKEFTDIRFSIIHFQVSDDVVRSRLTMRLVCPKCNKVFSEKEHASTCDICTDIKLIKRADDTVESVNRRLEIYHTHEKDLLDYYTKQGQKIMTLQAANAQDEIFADFVAQMALKVE